jgi:hypothetical protein
MLKNIIIIILLLFTSCDYYNIQSNKLLPIEWDWSSIDYNQDGIKENYVSPIVYQTGNNCVAFAIIGALEIQYKIDHLLPIEINFSEQNLSNCLRLDYFNEIKTLDYIQIYGVLEDTYSKKGIWLNRCDNCEKYLERQGFGLLDISNIPFYGFNQYLIYNLSNVSYYEKREKIKQLLLHGPIIATFDQWDSLLNEKSGRLICIGNKTGNGHVVNIVGYKENGDVLIIKNSHGDGGLKEMILNHSENCGFGKFLAVLDKTWTKYGQGQEFCFSEQDHDKDEIPDAYDNCPYISNKNQENKDNDLLGDLCDPNPDCVVEWDNPWETCTR